MTPDQQPLTKQDLREALDAVVQSLGVRFDAIAAKQDATDARLDNIDARLDNLDARLDAAVQTLNARLEWLTEAFAHNLTDLRGELMQQLELLQNRTERTELNISSILIQLGGMNKALGAFDRSAAQTASTQAAQQRAIEDLYAQIAELKRRLLPPQ